MANETKQQMVKAKKLIQAKQYEDARAILITIDHPIAEKWLSKLPAPAPEKEKAQSTAKGCGALIVIALVCSVIFALMPSDDAKSNVGVACAVARDEGFFCNPDLVMETWPDAVAFCEDTVGDSPIDYKFYVFCLQAQGVNMGQ